MGTPGNVKLLLPPRQSRGNSLGGLEGYGLAAGQPMRKPSFGKKLSIAPRSGAQEPCWKVPIIVLIGTLSSGSRFIMEIPMPGNDSGKSARVLPHRFAAGGIVPVALKAPSRLPFALLTFIAALFCTRGAAACKATLTGALARGLASRPQGPASPFEFVGERQERKGADPMSPNSKSETVAPLGNLRKVDPVDLLTL
jgi:hypothetical protein